MSVSKEQNFSNETVQTFFHDKLINQASYQQQSKLPL